MAGLDASLSFFDGPYTHPRKGWPRSLTVSFIKIMTENEILKGKGLPISALPSDNFFFLNSTFS